MSFCLLYLASGLTHSESLNMFNGYMNGKFFFLGVKILFELVFSYKKNDLLLFSEDELGSAEYCVPKKMTHPSEIQNPLLPVSYSVAPC